MRLTFVLLATFLLAPSVAFAQDPSCEFIINLHNVDLEKYDYKFIIEHRHEKYDLVQLKEWLAADWDSFNNDKPYSVLESEAGNQILMHYERGYCYPQSRNDDQLRITIARKNKRENTIELMNTSCSLMSGTTEIHASKFQIGKRDHEVFHMTGPISDFSNRLANRKIIIN
ncbi:hypothetical protein [Nonlabens ponticola]|uniref:Uncharacterized protein n=1 Tax=Nonlabens ponticola TaxID=2496866 RepID=A0A3S9MY77_9FLAO|nr:hypothetical protein [Nonlabens ponticola]AZQ44098.1 hypothetical protein EJ995_07585 [Nonlabens ponticola]